MDYRKYRCNLWERLGCLAAGTAVAAAIAWLFYRSWYGMVLVIPVNYLIVSYYKNKKRDERAKKLMIEFRDAIQAVAAALLAGDRKSTRLNSSHTTVSRMPSSA